MKAIVEYTDYRKFIQDYYDERKRDSAFTWREFAQNAGFASAIFLKYVAEGKKNLSISAASSVANAMGLAGFEKTYFVLMVTYAHAKGDEAKMAAFEKRCALARAHKIRVLGGEEFDYYKSWKNPLLRELAPHMPGARPAEMARACKPKISAAEVSETLDFLEDANLLRYEMRLNGRLSQQLKVSEVTASTLSETPFYRMVVKRYQDSYFSISKTVQMKTNYKDEIKTVNDGYDVFVARLINQTDKSQIGNFLEELKDAKVFEDRKNYTRLKKKIENVASKANVTVSNELIKELDDDIKNCGAYV